MYSLTKGLSSFSVILAVIHIITGVSILIYATAFHLEFAFYFAISLYILAGSVGFTALAWGLRNLCIDLNLEYEDKTNSYLDLKKRIDELEHKVK